MEQAVSIAVIGGSGLYEMDGLEDVRRVSIHTPFGDPSDEIVVARLGGTPLAFLPRHGRGHRILPSELNSRANIYALKMLGVKRILSISAVGSLREEIAPLHAVVPDQLLDRTRGRPATFFGNGIAAHVGFAEPFCPELSAIIADVARDCGATVHRSGTYVCMEGPQFSTKAESRMYRQLGADIIGMTAIPEAKLAREAEICYATLAFVTDYDVWNGFAETVSADMVVRNLQRNVELAKHIVREVIPIIPHARDCVCSHALRDSVMTAREQIPDRVRDDLAPIIGRYLPTSPASPRS
ncbi:MAG: S-methyl-5'-thioadenosine phosphorylase [Chloroflexota bacterium]